VEHDDDHSKNSHVRCRAPRGWNFAGDSAERSRDRGANRLWLVALMAVVGVAAGMAVGWYAGAPVYGYGYAPYRPLYGYYRPYWRYRF
jgi:hypothetical protein